MTGGTASWRSTNLPTEVCELRALPCGYDPPALDIRAKWLTARAYGICALPSRRSCATGGPPAVGARSSRPGRSECRALRSSWWSSTTSLDGQAEVARQDQPLNLARSLTDLQDFR